MSLVTKQARFAQCVSLLLQYANKMGYQVTFGDAYRDPRVKYGHPKSCHRSRLAVDLNLFKDGKLLSTVQEYETIGLFWERLDAFARWGGRFDDAYHFSFEHDGVK